jgi:prophage maintenance system killer protein
VTPEGVVRINAALVAMIGFLGANGYDLEIADDDHNADVLIEAVTGRISEDAFIAALRPHVWPSRR